MLDQEPFLISIAEAARRLRVSESTLHEQHQKGQAPFIVYIGRRKRVSTIRLEMYLHGRVISPDLAPFAAPEVLAEAAP